MKKLCILFLFLFLFLTYLPAYSQDKDEGLHFVLLYSTLCYELNGTKRALIRTIDHVDPEIVDTRKSSWKLLDENSHIKMTGKLNYLGMTYGLQLWEIDFSDLQDPGFYQITADLKNKEDALYDSVSTLVFEVRNQLYTSRTLITMSIHNAEARKSPVQQGGGYYDCNSQMAEACSHGIFLAGLVNAYERRGQYLSSEERTRLARAINIAVDYILAIHIDTTGRILPCHPLRKQPVGNWQGSVHSRDALFGLVSYAHLFKNEDPFRAKITFEKSLKTVEYLKTTNQMPLELEVLAYYHLFKYSGNEKYKESAISALNNQLDNYVQYGPGNYKLFSIQEGTSVSEIFSHFWRGIPYFEGLNYCVKEFGDHPDYSSWLRKAKTINETYLQDVIEKNGFHVVPEGGEEAWNDMKTIPSGGFVDGWVESTHFYPNTRFASWASDAIFLAEVTGDLSLERIATASLGWITGLNPGVYGEMAMNPYSRVHVALFHEKEQLVSAAFIINLDSRHVKPWGTWRWDPTTSMMTIVNGFIIEDGKWVWYNNRGHKSFLPAESYFKHDGAFLYATCLYEDYLNK